MFNYYFHFNATQDFKITVAYIIQTGGKPFHVLKRFPVKLAAVVSRPTATSSFPLPMQGPAFPALLRLPLISFLFQKFA